MKNSWGEMMQLTLNGQKIDASYHLKFGKAHNEFSTPHPQTCCECGVETNALSKETEQKTER